MVEDSTLIQDEKQIFAEAVHEIRFGETEPGARPTIQPLQLLKPRRFDDHGDDLWRVFNVAQEHVIRGGDHGLLINERGQRRRTSTRSRERDRPRRSVEQGALVAWRENGGAQESRLNRKKKGEALDALPVFVYELRQNGRGTMQKHIAVGLMQVISASIAGGLLGDTIPHAVGIFCALYALAPIVYGKE